MDSSLYWCSRCSRCLQTQGSSSKTREKRGRCRGCGGLIGNRRDEVEKRPTNYIFNLEGCVCNLFKCGSGLDLVAVASSLGGWLLLSLEGEEQPPILPPVYLLHSDHLRLLLISRDLLNPIILVDPDTPTAVGSK